MAVLCQARFLFSDKAVENPVESVENPCEKSVWRDKLFRLAVENPQANPVKYFPVKIFFSPNCTKSKKPTVTLCLLGI